MTDETKTTKDRHKLLGIKEDEPSSTFTCPVCDKDDWEGMDYLRKEKTGFVICRECAFQTYHPADRKYKEESELLDFYRFEYRRHPNGDNVITCNRKMGYFQSAYGDFYAKKKHKNWRVLDIGCAQGYFLGYLKQIGYKPENLFGTEYTVTYRNYANNFYGLKNVTEEYDKTKKYDYIHICHVLEHMHEPDKKLLEFRDMLKDDGYLMVAVPVWHHGLYDSAKASIASFEDLYHTAHVNVWTQRAVRNLLNKTGWRIVEENSKYYGYMLMLKKGPIRGIIKEDYKKIIDSTKREKEAISHYERKEFLKALQIYPNYPDAIYGRAFFDHKENYQMQVQILEEALRIMPEVPGISVHLGNTHWQWKNYDKALKIFDQVIKLRPHDDFVLDIMARCFIEKGQYIDACKALQRLMLLNPGRWSAYMDLMGNVLSKDWKKAPVRVLSPTMTQKRRTTHAVAPAQKKLA